MKLIVFEAAGGAAFGVVTPRGVVTLEGVSPTEVLSEGEAALQRVRAAGERADSSHARAESELTLLPCVPQPGKIIAVGLNYRRHAQETGAPIPETPILFSKFNNTLAASCQKVKLPEVAAQYDYEVELGVVIGKQAAMVSEASALDYVLGYCTANDLSARDLQMRTSQWLLGKSLDGFCPVGPYLVTRDEVADPQQLELHTWVNGQERQNSSTADMIFS